MKEIWKLIELLNEYLFGLWRKTIIESYRKDCLEDVCWTFRWIVEWKKDYPYTSIWGIEVISKKFWFIEWLVENDKIDTESYCRITSIERKWEKDVYRDEVDSLLMLLAIQDEPIEFLISILK